MIPQRKEHAVRDTLHIVAPQDDETLPQEQGDDPMVYETEVLPELRSMEDIANWLAQLTRHFHFSGQMIVKDFRMQRQALDYEAERLEQDRANLMNAINATVDDMVMRNRQLAGGIDSMIAFYTREPAPQPEQAPQQVRERRRGGLLSLFGG